MKTILTSVKIWAKTVVLNAFLFGIFGLCIREWSAVFMSFVLLIGGFFVTTPLLLLIDPIVKISLRLPYKVEARIAWMFYYLAVLIILVYVLVWAIMDGEFKPKGVFLLSCCTISALLIAVLTTRKSLNKINAGSGEILKK